MMTEDYVSFEIAKLLKEKGFNEIKCNTCYKWNGNFCNNRRSMSGIDNEICYQAPNLQMAMKWLRNQHNLHIMVDCIGSKNYIPTIQFICNSKDIKVESDENKICGNGFDSFEEACEAAIKYCLENLI